MLSRLKKLVKAGIVWTCFRFGIFPRLHNRFTGSLQHGNWLRKHRRMKIGENTMVNIDAHLMDWWQLEIGSNTTVSFCTFITHDGAHHSHPERRPDGPRKYKPTIVGDHVLIGCNVTIYPETVIGDGAVIYAGSVVRGVIPPGAIVKPDFAAPSVVTPAARPAPPLSLVETR